MRENQLQQLKEDLKSYIFRIRYRDGSEKREHYFWIPSPFGCCAIDLIQYRGRKVFRVKTEDLTNPDGPDTEEFHSRVGIPGMTDPSEYGLVTRTEYIPLHSLDELRIQKQHFSSKLIVWEKRNRRLMRRETSGYIGCLREYK